MAKTDIIVSGADATVTFNSSLIPDINTISFGVVSERDEINLTTLTNTLYETKRLGDLVGIEDLVINKKFSPATDLAISQDNKSMVIAFKVGGSTAASWTGWCQFKGCSNSNIERAPDDGVNVDLTFAVTNLNAALAETGPVIA